jgi:hypothetical protein
MENNRKEINISQQKINDLVIKCQLLKESYKKNFEESNFKTKDKNEDVNKNREYFIELFQKINKYQKELNKIQMLGMKIEKELDIGKINGTPDTYILKIEDKLKALQTQSVKWNKQLEKLENNSSEEMELHSLYGLNLLYINDNNWQHYLSYFLNVELYAEKISMESQNSIGSMEKIKWINELSKILPHQKSKSSKHEIFKSPEMYAYGDKENVYEIMLKILFAFCHDDEVKYSSFKTNLLFKKNKILLCSEATSKAEIQSKSLRL